MNMPIWSMMLIINVIVLIYLYYRTKNILDWAGAFRYMIYLAGMALSAIIWVIWAIIRVVK